MGDEHRPHQWQAICIWHEARPEVSRFAVRPSKVFGVFDRVPDGSSDTTGHQQSSLEESERIVFIARCTCRSGVNHRSGYLEVSHSQ